MITTSEELERFFTGLCHQNIESRKNDPNLMNKLIMGNMNEEEEVDHPDHYQSETGMEAIDVIEAFDLNFNLGNCIKYVLRAGKKEDELQDLKKALWYIKRQIKNLEMGYEDGER
jgi:hypothetical protein